MIVYNNRNVTVFQIDRNIPVHNVGGEIVFDISLKYAKKTSSTNNGVFLVERHDLKLL